MEVISLSYFRGMDILHNNRLINEIVDKLFKHRRSDYSELALQHALSLTALRQQVLRVPNRNYETLHASLFAADSRRPDLCILFMHGYGSNRLECASILRALPEQWALCAFDFSGSGKSEGDLVTYGMKEQEDIDCMMGHLRQAGFGRFVLWGRSMGATTALLYSLRHRPQDVLLQVVDSPFYSFQMVAFEIASKNVKAPDFLISLALQLAKKNCQQFQYNPFEIDLAGVGDCPVPALFLYSEEDSVINCQNTHLICAKYRAVFEKLAIAENHNTVRTQGTLDKIFAFIEKYAKKPKRRLSQEINELYFDCRPSHPRLASKRHSRGQSSLEPSAEKGSLRKGIERVEAERSKRFDDYGIWVGSEISPTAVTPQASSIKRKSGSVKRPHLSLSSSLATKHVREIDSVLSPTFQDFSKQPSSCLFSAKTSTSEKEKRGKKISTVKSMGSSQGLSNSKYL